MYFQEGTGSDVGVWARASERAEKAAGWRVQEGRRRQPHHQLDQYGCITSCYYFCCYYTHRGRADRQCAATRERRLSIADSAEVAVAAESSSSSSSQRRLGRRRSRNRRRENRAKSTTPCAQGTERESASKPASLLSIDNSNGRLKFLSLSLSYTTTDFLASHSSPFVCVSV